MDALPESQALEIESLTAIYGDEVVKLAPAATDAPQPVVQVRLPVELGQETLVCLPPSSKSVDGSAELQLRLSYLPPVLIDLLLPAAYPEAAPPQLLNVALPSASPYCATFSLRQRIGTLLDQSYQQSGADICIWAFLEQVREAHFLDRNDAGDIVLQPVPGVDPAALGGALSKHEAEVLGKGFAETTFPCGICLENRKGAKCVEFQRCRHVFCRECVESCFSLAIREGDVLSVACPSFDCIKARSSKAVADPPPSSSALDAQEEEDLGAIVLDLVGEEAKARWLHLKEKKRLDADPTITICPQPSCQASVPAPPSANLSGADEVDGLRVPNGWDRYRQCPKCSFSYCVFCSNTWHGPHTPCPLSSIPAFIKTYYELAPDDPQRIQLERRYGKRNLEKLAAKALEDEENRKWFEANSKGCPGCHVLVEKTHGCNHMICVRCQCHFCYRCAYLIKPSAPYEHFNTPGSSCHMKLFDDADVAAWARGGDAWDEGAFR